MKRNDLAWVLSLLLLLGVLTGCQKKEEAGEGPQDSQNSQQESKPEGEPEKEQSDGKEQEPVEPIPVPALKPVEEAAAQATAQGITQGGIHWKVGEDGKQYVVFNGADRAYSGMQGQLDEKTGTLTVNVHSSDGSSGICVYEVDSSSPVKNLVVLDNGQQVEVSGFPAG